MKTNPAALGFKGRNIKGYCLKIFLIYKAKLFILGIP